MNITERKSEARAAARRRRAVQTDSLSGPAWLEIIGRLPMQRFQAAVIGGFWPLLGEIDLKPLMHALHEQGHQLALPCTPPMGQPLTFRKWKPTHTLKPGPYDTREPYPEQPVMYPTLVLVPLLAFTQKGERLGYGGGFYDRTLAALKQRQEVFACGVAYAGQEAPHIPTDEYDHRLDGILTEDYFKAFT